MRRTKYIIGMILMAVYMVSMAHAMLHSHLHSCLHHADEQHVCSCGCNCASHDDHKLSFLDHTHSPEDKSECNIVTQFIPSTPTIKYFVKITNLPYFNISAVVALLDSISEEGDYYQIGDTKIETPPEITHLSFRAPPISHT